MQSVLEENCFLLIQRTDFHTLEIDLEHIRFTGSQLGQGYTRAPGSWEGSCCHFENPGEVPNAGADRHDNPVEDLSFEAWIKFVPQLD